MILENKVSIISGIGPGLGQELAYAFAREGSDVVLVARTESKLEEVAAEIAKQWPDRRALICPTDISDSAQTQRMVDATLAEFGRIDCLVNSAYVPPLSQCSKMPTSARGGSRSTSPCSAHFNSPSR